LVDPKICFLTHLANYIKGMKNKLYAAGRIYKAIGRHFIYEADAHVCAANGAGGLQKQSGRTYFKAN
jgi:hypothetical protein